VGKPWDCLVPPGRDGLADGWELGAAGIPPACSVRRPWIRSSTASSGMRGDFFPM
jgi:hypothetical protein